MRAVAWWMLHKFGRSLNESRTPYSPPPGLLAHPYRDHAYKLISELCALFSQVRNYTYVYFPWQFTKRRAMLVTWSPWYLSFPGSGRPRWSRGNVLASRSKVLGFKSGWGRLIFSGRNSEHNHKGFRKTLPSLEWPVYVVPKRELNPKLRMEEE